LETHAFADTLVEDRAGIYWAGLGEAEAGENWAQDEDAGVEEPVGEVRISSLDGIRLDETRWDEMGGCRTRSVSYLALNTIACL